MNNDMLALVVGVLTLLAVALAIQCGLFDRKK